MNNLIFSTGKVVLPSRNAEIADLEWHEHPSYKGVYLKHLLLGCDTENQISCHLVRIDSDREIGLHSHKGKTELHEVVSGKGSCVLADNTLVYESGIIVQIPADVEHRVVASGTGLYLLAKFFPALL